MQPDEEARNSAAGSDLSDTNNLKTSNSKMDHLDDDIDRKRSSVKNEFNDDKNDDDDADLDDGDPSSNY